MICHNLIVSKAMGLFYIGLSLLTDLFFIKEGKHERYSQKDLSWCSYHRRYAQQIIKDGRRKRNDYQCPCSHCHQRIIGKE